MDGISGVYFDVITHANRSSAIGCHQYGKRRLLRWKEPQKRFHDRLIAAAGRRMRMRCQASRYRSGHLEIDLADANVPAYPALLVPRRRAIDGNVRTKTLFGDIGRFSDGIGQRRHTATRMQ